MSLNVIRCHLMSLNVTFRFLFLEKSRGLRGLAEGYYEVNAPKRSNLITQAKNETKAMRSIAKNN